MTSPTWRGTGDSLAAQPVAGLDPGRDTPASRLHLQQKMVLGALGMTVNDF